MRQLADTSPLTQRGPVVEKDAHPRGIVAHAK
jgi:hypothetical protein